MKITIVDYKLSNTFSLTNALHYLNFQSIVTSNKKEILSADALILPGVGSFPEAMQQLKKHELIDPIKSFIKSGKPFLGICLGFQLLFNQSEEFKKTDGLGILSGKVLKFDESKLKVPHIGWNYIDIINNKQMYGIKSNLSYYFVHSFYVKPDDNNLIFTYTNYKNFKFCSSVKKENIFACQFHPEKSGIHGLNLLKTFFN